MKKIVILQANSGQGHTSLAIAIKEALELNSPKKFSFEFIDPLPKFYQHLYSKLNSDWQNIWGAIWHSTNNQLGSKVLYKSLCYVFRYKMIKLINDQKPDIIISPVELVTPNLDWIKNEIHTRPKIVLYIADPFTPHLSWFVNKDVDLFLSPTKTTTELGLKNGLSIKQINTVGWLTREKFFRRFPTKQNLRRNLGLNPSKFTIFIGGSGGGGGNIGKLVEKLSSKKIIKDGAQIIVNTGYNYSLIKKLLPLTKDSKSLIHILPYVQNLPELLSSSDIVVGKAGPNLLFESIHLNKPFLATGCLPGQEEGNSKFIINQKIGWVEDDVSKVVNIIQKVILNPKSLDSKIINLKKISSQHRNTNIRIANSITKLN